MYNILQCAEFQMNSVLLTYFKRNQYLALCWEAGILQEMDFHI